MFINPLIRGDAATLSGWLQQPSPQRLGRLALLIIAGCGVYGATIGWWRAPLMGLYVGIKMPLLIFITLTVNGLLNGMAAQLLGSGLSFRQTLESFLQSFAVFAIIVASLSPIFGFLLWVGPGMGEPGGAAWYRVLVLGHTCVIAFAGIQANLRLLNVLEHFAGSRSIARRVLTAWLAGNLFVGAQISYLFRPFFGNPDLEVQFLRPNWNQGSFYETIYTLAKGSPGLVFGVLFVLTCAWTFTRLSRFAKNNNSLH